MPNELIETAKELRLLGWSEEGAKSYTELFLSDNIDIIRNRKANGNIIKSLFNAITFKLSGRNNSV